MNDFKAWAESKGAEVSVEELPISESLDSSDFTFQQGVWYIILTSPGLHLVGYNSIPLGTRVDYVIVGGGVTASVNHQVWSSFGNFGGGNTGEVCIKSLLLYPLDTTASQLIKALASKFGGSSSSSSSGGGFSLPFGAPFRRR